MALSFSEVSMRDSVRTLFVMKDSPYPPRSGSPLRNWLNVNAMAKLGPVAVFSVGDSEAETNSIPGVTLWQHHDGGHVRASRLKKAWSYMRRLVQPREFPTSDDRRVPEIMASLAQTVDAFDPQIVVLANWQQALPSALRHCRFRLVVDAHNIESTLISDILRNSSDKLTVLRSYVRRAYATSLERRLFRSADQIWLTSNDDARELTRLVPKARSYRVIPNAVDVQYYDPVRAASDSCVKEMNRQRHTVCFVGHYGYEPNARAANVLIEEVLPRLRERFADTRMLFIGRSPTPAMLEAASRDSAVQVTGSVADTRPYLSAASVTVVPLMLGGGTRLKVLEAFACGLPVVTTPKGCEGLAVQDDEHLLIREDAAALAQATCELWADPARATRLARNAYTLVTREYSWEAIFGKVHEAIGALNATG
jgi:glycosyltransferase involved in cell wall biosynthesis